ncbi:MAG: undecaprenyl-diphosphate phosphatase [Kiritimatiellaeota bacterium]|nr:undecaprenyl-diphosphate phosphatase [Kiritimatiellota bacterium]
MSDTANVFVLSILQGIAEFLPISSSGHLVLGKHLLGLESPGTRLEIALHVGTLLSVLAFYREVIFRLAKGAFTGCKESWRMVLHIIVACVPAIIFYLLFRKSVDAFFESTRTVSLALIFTGVVLCALRWVSVKGGGAVTLPRAVAIGLAQAVAVLPGVSRSGMTIAMARMTGVAPEKSAEFSFLVSLPLIAGATVKEVLHASPALSHDVPPAHVPLGLLVVGVLIAACVGYVALTLLVRLLRGNHFWCFGVYCLVAGALAQAFLR